MAQDAITKIPEPQIIVRAGLDNTMVVLFRNQANAVKTHEILLKNIPASKQSKQLKMGTKTRTEGEISYTEIRMSDEEFDLYFRDKPFTMKPGNIFTKSEGFGGPTTGSKFYKEIRSNAIIILKAIEKIYCESGLNNVNYEGLDAFTALFARDANNTELFNQNPEYLLRVIQKSSPGKEYKTSCRQMLDLMVSLKHLSVENSLKIKKLLELNYKKLTSKELDAQIIFINNLKFDAHQNSSNNSASSSSAPTTTASTSNFTATQSFLHDIKDKMNLIYIEKLPLFQALYMTFKNAFKNINLSSTTEDEVLINLNSDLYKIFSGSMESGILNDEESCVAALRIMMLASLRTNPVSGEQSSKWASKIFNAESFQDIINLVDDGYAFISHTDLHAFCKRVKEKFPVTPSSRGSVSTNSSLVSTVYSTSSTTASVPLPPPAPAMSLDLLGKSPAEIENDKAAKEINITAGLFNGLEKILDASSPVKWPDIRAKIVALFKDASIQSKEAFKQEWSKYLSETGIVFKQDTTSQDAFTGLERRLVLAYGNKGLKRREINPFQNTQDGLVEELKKFGGVEKLRKTQVNHDEKKTDTVEQAKPLFATSLKRTGSPLLGASAVNTAQQQPQPNSAESEAGKTTGLKQ